MIKKIYIGLFLFLSICNADAAEINFDFFYIANKISANEEATITKILDSINYGNPSQAINICDTKINNDNSKPTYYLFRGFAYMKQKNIPQAISDLTTAINKDSNFSIMSYYLRSLCYFSQNNYTNGFIDIEKALSMLNYLPKKSTNLPPKEERCIWHYRTSDNYHVTSYLINRAYVNFAKKYIMNEINKVQANPSYKPDYDKLNKMYNNMITSSETMYTDRSEIYDIELSRNMDAPISISDIGSSLQSLAPQTNNNDKGDGIDWDSYMATVQNKIRQVWTPDYTQHRRAIVRFTIARSGDVSNIRIETSSGSEHGDIDCINAIKQAAPFRPLPSEFKGSSINIQFTFTPNM